MNLTLILLFSVIVVGCLIGRIKICNISLDISAVLILSVVVGYVLSKTDIEIDAKYLNVCSQIGTSLFISVVGITSGFSIKRDEIFSNIRYVVMGGLIVFAGFVAARIIGFLDSNIDESLLVGIFCGAMTSTPGLSAACESETVRSELAVLGYGSAYLIGVLGIVLFVQLSTGSFPEIRKVNIFQEKKSNIGQKSLVAIGLTCVCGQVLGAVKFSVLNISLGATGGVLICGLIIGIVINKFSREKDSIGMTLPVYRDLGLVLFFAGNGLVAGQELNTQVEISWFVYAAIITLSSVFAGKFFGKVIIKNSLLNQMCSVAGGMTSTPAMGCLLKKTDNPSDLTAYSLSYLGALVFIIGIVRCL